MGLVAIQVTKGSRMLHLSKDGTTSLCNAAGAPILPGSKHKPAGHTNCMKCLKSVNLRHLKNEEVRKRLEEGKIYVADLTPGTSKLHYAHLVEVDSGGTFVTKELVLRTICGQPVSMQTTVSDPETTTLRATCKDCLGSPRTPEKYRDRVEEENLRIRRSAAGFAPRAQYSIWDPQPEAE